MEAKNMTFGIPDYIKKGLENGTYKRFDTGVVREAKTGRIVLFLKEISNIESNDQLQLTGFAGLGIINLAGFLYLGIQIKQLRNQIKQLQESINKLNIDIELINKKQDINFIIAFERAVAAYLEGDYEDGLKYARECSSDVWTYIKNMPTSYFILNEKLLNFLIFHIIGSLQLQLACAQKCKPAKIGEILDRYENLFLNIQQKLNIDIKKINDGIPNSEQLKCLITLKNKNCFTNRLISELPKAIQSFKTDKYFIDVCSQGNNKELILKKVNSGTKCIAVLEP